MPRCHPLRINNVVLVVATSCKKKNNCKKIVSVLSNHCFDFSRHSSASRPKIIPLRQSRWDLFMSWPMKENQVNQWKNHQQFTSDMASLRDERQKAWKIGREEDKFDSNVERKYWSFTCNQLRFLYVDLRIQSVSHIQIIWEMRDREHGSCEWKGPFKLWKHSKG